MLQDDWTGMQQVISDFQSKYDAVDSLVHKFSADTPENIVSQIPMFTDTTILSIATLIELLATRVDALKEGIDIAIVAYNEEITRRSITP